MSFLVLKNSRILISVILLIALISGFFSTTSSYALENTQDMSFECESAILMEAKTGTVLYSYNPNKPLPPASVTKIMTLLLIMEAIESGDLKYSDTITASAYAASMGGSQIFLKEGEQMSAEDLIKSVVIASANDAAVALAEHLCGSEDAFVKKMNERAAELGMINTNFENTNGLDDSTTNHVTSAMDIAIMSRELIKHKDILKFSSTWMDTIRNGSFGLTNTNRLVRFYTGATGLKTGSTDKAKFCVSATAERNGMHLICVIMGAPTSSVRNSIATQLLNWGFANYELFESNAPEFHPLRTLGGVENLCYLTSENFYVVVPKGQAKNIETKINLPKDIQAPISKNQVIGNIEYLSNGKALGTSPIYATTTIPKIDFATLLLRVFSKFVLK